MAKDRHVVVAFVLEQAAAHMERVGWHQDSYFATTLDDEVNDPEAPCCPLGALRVVLDLHSDGHGVAEAAAEVEAYLDLHSGELPEWNDAAERDQDEVLAALRQTALVLRSEDAS